MKLASWEIIILKPTLVFLSLLAARLPHNSLPTFGLLQIDNTAYLIKKTLNDDQLLEKIHQHFAKMFTHEIRRWFGEEFNPKIIINFLDFLCCFQLEIHSQVLLMESSLTEGKKLISLKPLSLLKRWIENPKNFSEMELFSKELMLTKADENSTVIIKNFNDLTDLKIFLSDHYELILETEMSRINKEKKTWPVIRSYQEFSHYFAVNLHSNLIHLH